MEAFSRVRRGFTFTLVGRFLDIHGGVQRLARFDLCPTAAEPVRIGTFRLEGDRAWVPLEGGIEGKAVVDFSDDYVTYTVETS